MSSADVDSSPASRARHVAVVLAGGMGTRVGVGIPKQLITIAGRTILEHTINAFDSHPMVDDVYVLMAPGHLDAVHEILDKGSYPKVREVLEGADTRSGTTRRALDRLGEAECHVLLHDAARPMVTARIITECFEALRTHPAVAVAIPSADTIIEVTERNTVASVLPRAALRRVQTPQAFHSSVIKAAYLRAAQDPDFAATDDCSVVLKYLPGTEIRVVAGDVRNMKVTEPIDVHLADALFRLNSSAPAQERDRD